jgi:hypothetical protein
MRLLHAAKKSPARWETSGAEMAPRRRSTRQGDAAHIYAVDSCHPVVAVAAFPGRASYQILDARAAALRRAPTRTSRLHVPMEASRFLVESTSYSLR